MSGGVACRRPLRVRSDLSVMVSLCGGCEGTFLLFGHDDGEAKISPLLPGGDLRQIKKRIKKPGLGTKFQTADQNLFLSTSRATMRLHHRRMR